MISNAYWIVLTPLLSSLIIFFFGRWLPLSGALLGILAIGYSFLHSASLLVHVIGAHGMVADMAIPWFRFGIFETQLSCLIDGLSVLMLVIVTFVSLLVHIYSLGYMHGEPRFKRYYAYLSFFSFAMLLLVVSNNFLQMFIGWELVGVASYLLIGFYFEKESAASAGRKAFITTKFGDLGFFIAIMMIFSLIGSLNFAQVEARIQDGLIAPMTASIIGVLLFLGAVGKSAQVPLHVWLPDAMEGPTPVSALIHAATMVAAGVYMIARVYFLFEYGSFSLEVIAWTGGITAFFAATMAIVATDIKRVLAFSTISQLGYMVLAMGVGSPLAGMFHLTTHAFFKALLFLGAGSVIHAVHTNDIRQMGGLSKKMLGTFWTFSFAWLAISGIWPFAGYYSKDAVLEAAHSSGHLTLFWVGVISAFITAFYMTRLYLLVFVTDPRDIKKFSHAHESPNSMVIPMSLLALLALGCGFVLHHVWPLESFFPAHLLETAVAHHGHAEVPHWFVPLISSVAAVSGIFLAFLVYVQKVVSADSIAKTFAPVRTLLDRRFYLDELYLNVVIKNADRLAGALYYFDNEVYDRWGVDGVGSSSMRLSRLQNWFDRYIVDGCVNLWGVLAQFFGIILRAFQTGLAQNYILMIVLGLGGLIFWRFQPYWSTLCHR